LLSGQTPRRTARGNGQSGRVQNLTRGRPAGIRPGRLGNGARLSIIDTLRAAIPWQTIRKTSHNTTRIAIRADDFRLRRFKENERVISIFAVDASGSAALNRLGEAKGAIQLLLADCYIRRDQVALLAFRNRSAELLLPPTNALARAKRSLNGLPGGGPTPLATGIDAARALAESERRKGVQPLLVFLTDGGANIGRDGQPGRAQAGADALNAARLCRAAGLKALVVDTAPRPQAFVAKLAVEMGARYLPLPYADAAALSRAVQQQEPAYASRAA
jgi:magnesium chelatase subunit D